MSSLEALKQTWVIQMEQITRERQKYRDLTDADPATFKVNRMKESLRKVRAKKDELDNTHAEISVHTEYIDEGEETRIQQTFEEDAEATIDLISELIEVQKIHLGIKYLRGDMASLIKQQDEQPDKQHTMILNKLSKNLDKIRATLSDAALSSDNPYHSELQQLQDLFLSRAATSKGVPKEEHPSIHAEPEPPRRRKMAHLKLAVPKFNGDILQWDVHFKTNIDSDPLYTEVDKLCYLQEAIEDPANCSME